ncbi:hypothetical protein [Amycolatopsis sp. cmx-4-61]|uniref:hypothetical protein n=1 Tax=Amycolatopsis sp. cmx-4-61 TaxID=2790937 RepID=UPI00397E0DF5
MEPAWIAGIAAIVSSGAAIWSATNGNRTLKRADRDSQARTRPMVAAQLERRPHVPRTQFLLIKNYGPTIARNVAVTFEPPLQDPAPAKEPQSVAPFLKRRYSKPIPVLVPGTELDNVYFWTTDGRTNQEPFPDQVRVAIDFDGPDGEHYRDYFDLDVMLLRSRSDSVSSTHPDQVLKEAVKQLTAIRSALDYIASSLPDEPTNQTGGARKEHE